jgi:DNA helicase-2/ATP-dependent DNA helicase PcrA
MTKTQQDLAIEKVKGPCLIVAGAGTGKTTTIVNKVKHLVDSKACNSNEILCLTFSNEATNNLRLKIQDKGIRGADITVRTFHGFCADILKELGHLLKIDPGFEILLPDDAVVWMHHYLEVSPYWADVYVSSISTIKDLGISMQQIEDHLAKLKQELGNVADPDKEAAKLEVELNTLHLNPDRKQASLRKKEINLFLKAYHEYAKYRDFIDAWKKYEALKKEKNVLDYADLNFNVLKIFNRYGPKEIADKYKYIIIDEFQDTNKLQFELIEYIAKEHRNITVVGDPNQSIYGFRGAYKQTFDHFKEAFSVDEKKDVFKLDKSHRSPNTVLRVAHKLILNNYEDPKECFLVENADDIEGDKVKLFEMKNEAEEARKIAELVDEEIEKETPLDKICVLFRTHKQGKALRQALEARKIPTVSAGRSDLMMKPEIKTAIAYLSILNNLVERTGTGEQSWWHLFHYQNALSPEDSIKIGRYLKKKRDDEISIDEALLTSQSDIDLSAQGKLIVKRVVEKLKELMKSSNKPLPELVLDVYGIVGLNRAFTSQRNTKNVEALMNLKLFYSLSENYYKTHGKSLGSFIEYVEILEKVGVEIEASKIQDANAVRVMTMHATKGLEFDAVFVTNMAEDRFPIERTQKEPLIPKELNPDIKRYLDSLGKLDDEAKIDAIKAYEKASILYEERRLCYVALTRARNRLYLSFARSYNDEPDSNGASKFLTEMEYTTNKDIEHKKDEDEKGTIFAPSSRFEQYKSLLKKQLLDSLDSEDFNTILTRLVTYHAVRECKIDDYSSVDWKKIVDKKELNDHIKMHCEKCSCVKFDAKSFTFSPTALLNYDDCPKKYELANIYQMPERGAFEWSGASTGSFMHEVLQIGVKKGFASKGEFVDLAEEMSAMPEWKGVDLDDVNSLIDVFWARHQGKYNKDTKVEEWFNVDLSGFKFVGKFDRIDFLNDKDIEIIDYKTDKQAIKPKKRAWQLGFYAIAAKKEHGWNPVKLTLEMLRLEKPYTANVNPDGTVGAGRSEGFDIKEVEKELVDCAKRIVHDYEHEFKPTEDEENCRFCGFKFYCPKWEEK